MKHDIIKNILGQTTKKKKGKQKKMKLPIGQMYSVTPKFSNPNIGKPEEIEEAGELGGLSDQLGANDLPQVPKWTSNTNRGHANPIDQTTQWTQGTTRGHANSLFESRINLRLSQNIEILDFDEIQKGDILMCVNFPSDEDFQILRNDHNVTYKKLFTVGQEYIVNDVWGGTIEVTDDDGNGHLLSDGVWFKGLLGFEWSFYQVFRAYRKKEDINEGRINLRVKKENPSERIDTLIDYVRKVHIPNMGDNIFELYGRVGNQSRVDKSFDAPRSLMRILFYPSGSLSFLHWFTPAMDKLKELLNTTDIKTIEMLLKDWFISRHGDKLTGGIHESWIFPKKIDYQEFLDNNVRKVKKVKSSYNDDVFAGYEDLNGDTPFIKFKLRPDKTIEPIYSNQNIIKQFMKKMGMRSEELFKDIFEDWFNNNFSSLFNRKDKIREGFKLRKLPPALDKLPVSFVGEIISDGTLNPYHLIPKYLNFLNSYRWSEKLQERIDELTGFWNEVDNSNDMGSLTEASDLLSEIEDFLTDVAPSGSYFGSSEGDGALMGFWVNDEKMFNKECPSCHSDNTSWDLDVKQHHCHDCGEGYDDDDES